MRKTINIREEFASFILFGELLDQETRGILAEAIHYHLTDPEYDGLRLLSSSQLKQRYPNWYPVIEKLFTETILSEAAHHNESLALHISQDIFSWLRKVATQFDQEHPHRKEESDLEYWQNHYMKQPREEWQRILKRLFQTYPQELNQWEFFARKIEQGDLPAISQSGTTKKDSVILLQHIIQEWKSMFERKKNASEAVYIQQQYSDYHQSLVEKFDKLDMLGDLLSPFYKFMGRFWSASVGKWNEIDWDKIQQFVNALEDDPQIMELAKMLGRWKMVEQEMEDTLISETSIEHVWNSNPVGKSEIIGIHHSNSISSALPSELALLSYPETSDIFSKRLAEKKLLTFQFRAREYMPQSRSTEVRIQKPKSEGRGPVILVIDTSGSMFGEPERIAKAISFVMLNLCLKEGRQCYLISFSTGIQTLELNQVEENLSTIVAFLKMSFHGGTDIQPALREAIRLLQTEKYAQADVLVLSDFVIPYIERSIFKSAIELREGVGTRFHSLLITNEIEEQTVPRQIFDQQWVYHLQKHTIIKETFEHLWEL